MPRLLVIEDDERSFHALHRALRLILPDDWEVIWEPTPSTGLSILVLDKTVKLCFVDMLLDDGMDGDELIENALKLRPDMHGRVIVCTGYPLGENTSRRLFDELGCLRLDKPVDFDLLQRFVWYFVHGGPKPAE